MASNNNNNNNNQNINPRPCVYGCGIQIYWNSLVNEYWEVFTKKKHICPNRGNKSSGTSIKSKFNIYKPNSSIFAIIQDNPCLLKCKSKIRLQPLLNLNYYEFPQCILLLAQVDNNII